MWYQCFNSLPSLLEVLSSCKRSVWKVDLTFCNVSNSLCIAYAELELWACGFRTAFWCSLYLCRVGFINGFCVGCFLFLFVCVLKLMLKTSHFFWIDNNVRNILEIKCLRLAFMIVYIPWKVDKLLPLASHLGIPFVR